MGGVKIFKVEICKLKETINIYRHSFLKRNENM